MRLFYRRGQHAAKRRHWLRVPFALGAVVALVLGLGAGAAYGYFLGAGSGSGAASTGEDPPVSVVEASGTVTDTLWPGSSGDLLVDVDNPNSFSVEIVTVTGAGAVTGSGGMGPASTPGSPCPPRSGCRSPWLPGDNVAVQIPNGVSMGATSDSGCQGATFHVPVTITVRKRMSRRPQHRARRTRRGVGARICCSPPVSFSPGPRRRWPSTSSTSSTPPTTAAPRPTSSSHPAGPPPRRTTPAGRSPSAGRRPRNPAESSPSTRSCGSAARAARPPSARCRPR